MHLRLIASTLGDIVKARTISQLARDAGLPRQVLHRALSGQDRPTFELIQRSPVRSACRGARLEMITS